ncbi:MAG: anti sigma factor C-terminal domain-containing protein [Ruminococcus sp.]|nr:anti sigma factor C-terminal domain-containing protein [Ruminococcus sp.]
MTYKELLNLYKNGELNEEQKNQVQADIERQEAISDYLFENDDIPGFTDTVFEAETNTDSNDFDEKHFQKMIKKSIRKAFVKLGVAVAAVVLVLMLAANTVLPYVVDSMYYNPAKIVGTSENGIESNRISLDTMVYTELFTPGYYRTQVMADREGYGKYDIQVLQSFSYNGIFKNVYGSIDKSKMTLFDDTIFKLPTSNAFVFEEVGHSGTGASGSAEDAKKKINDFNETDYYLAYVSFDKVMTYDELVAWSEKSGIAPEWCAVCSKLNDGVRKYTANDIIGFNYAYSASEQGYNKEKYPYLNSFDIPLDNATSKIMESHMTSMLRYMADNNAFCDMVRSNVSTDEFLELAENIEKNGLNIYGFAITAQKDTLLEISENENVSYIHTTPLA